MQNYTWLLIVLPIASAVGVLMLRPKKQAIAAPLVTSSGPDMSPVAPKKQILDLGGMALSEILAKLDVAIGALETGKVMPGAEALKGDQLVEAILVMARSATVAYRQSMEWRKERGQALDPVVSKSLSENLLDALRATSIGTDPWIELKSEMDDFHQYLLANRIWTVSVTDDHDGIIQPSPPTSPA